MANCRRLELPGHPPNSLRAAWSAMAYAQQSAFLSRLAHPATRAEYLCGWMAKFGWRVTSATLQTYRDTLAQTETDAEPEAKIEGRAAA